MKAIINSLFCIIFLAGTACFAQKADSVRASQDTTKGGKDSLKVQARKPDYFSKYKKPATTSTQPQVNDT